MRDVLVEAMSITGLHENALTNNLEQNKPIGIDCEMNGN